MRLRHLLFGFGHALLAFFAAIIILLALFAYVAGYLDIAAFIASAQIAPMMYLASIIRNYGVQDYPTKQVSEALPFVEFFWKFGKLPYFFLLVSNILHLANISYVDLIFISQIVLVASLVISSLYYAIDKMNSRR